MEIKKKQSTRKRSAARWIVVLLLLAVFLFSLYQILRILYGYRQAKAVYENAERAYLIQVSRDETEAVSYTHLDVYKRQGRDRALCGTGLSVYHCVPFADFTGDAGG